MKTPVFFAAIAALMAANPAAGHSLTHDECLEGGEFIRNAALSRDLGISREFFMSKLAEDVQLIQAFPPHLRWFVQDEWDEAFLSSAAARVFDIPMTPARHESDFISECIAATAASEQP